jgi:hypothetical protein
LPKWGNSGAASGCRERRRHVPALLGMGVLARQPRPWSATGCTTETIRIASHRSPARSPTGSTESLAAGFPRSNSTACWLYSSTPAACAMSSLRRGSSSTWTMITRAARGRTDRAESASEDSCAMPATSRWATSNADMRWLAPIWTVLPSSSSTAVVDRDLGRVDAGHSLRCAWAVSHCTTAVDRYVRLSPLPGPGGIRSRTHRLRRGQLDKARPRPACHPGYGGPLQCGLQGRRPFSCGGARARHAPGPRPAAYPGAEPGNPLPAPNERMSKVGPVGQRRG